MSIGNKVQCLSSFWLKIIAFVCMALDHVGYYLTSPVYYLNNPVAYQFGVVFRDIGRLAFPLFVFMIIEGILHTHNFWKYMAKLASIAGMVLVAQVVLDYAFNEPVNSPNIFFELISIGTFCYLITRPKFKKLYALIPLSYILLCTIVAYVERKNGLTILWLPYYLRPDYYLYGFIMGVLFFFSIKVARVVANKLAPSYMMDEESFMLTKEYQMLKNILICTSLCLVNAVWYLIYVVDNAYVFISLGMGVQCYSMIAIIPLLMYSGKRGYDSKVFRWIEYLFYPLHLVIIAAIFALL